MSKSPAAPENGMNSTIAIIGESVLTMPPIPGPAAARSEFLLDQPESTVLASQ